MPMVTFRFAENDVGKAHPGAWKAASWWIG
jgi:hypothetical protein